MSLRIVRCTHAVESDQKGVDPRTDQAVYSGNADVLNVPRVLEVMPREWESLNAKAELVCIATDTVSRQ